MTRRGSPSASSPASGLPKASPLCPTSPGHALGSDPDCPAEARCKEPSISKPRELPCTIPFCASFGVGEGLENKRLADSMQDTTRAPKGVYKPIRLASYTIPEVETCISMPRGLPCTTPSFFAPGRLRKREVVVINRVPYLLPREVDVLHFRGCALHCQATGATRVRYELGLLTMGDSPVGRLSC